ncbi:hypothetical protein [Spiroplasma endosymbiont of Asaphidion curtum]|uniref:hypothetical protein n=1 Tax=Spiroplasma endosymbiont of Asaphidion curtum TaxID=3066281 RepID=UPI00313E9056
MKFCKWIIEKNNHFIELNRTSFLILWHWGAIWYIYNGYFKNIVSYLFLAGCILIDFLHYLFIKQNSYKIYLK